MLKLTQTIEDPNGIVFKLIFEGDGAIAEAVVYRYGCRGVICFSVQSGCRVGCSFCGTGKRFIRDLTVDEMLYQITEGLKLLKDYIYLKIQIMSMSMGEPMDNMERMVELIEKLPNLSNIPPHDFFLSSVGLNDPTSIIQLISLFKYKHFGLQFSLHNACNTKRKKILGSYSKLLDISDLKAIANIFKNTTGKRAYFNYICKGNEDIEELNNLADIVEGQHLTCSVLCDTTKLAKGDQTIAETFMKKITSLNRDIEVSMFDPEGQDTIGGGCGQLLYVQQKLKQIKNDRIKIYDSSICSGL